MANNVFRPGVVHVIHNAATSLPLPTLATDGFAIPEHRSDAVVALDCDMLVELGGGATLQAPVQLGQFIGTEWYFSTLRDTNIAIGSLIHFALSPHATRIALNAADITTGTVTVRLARYMES